MVWTPGKPTVCGVTSWQSNTRISCRPRLFSRLIAWVRRVGRGGKTLLSEQRGESFKKGLLIFLNRQQEIGALVIERLAHGLHLGMAASASTILSTTLS